MVAAAGGQASSPALDGAGRFKFEVIHHSHADLAFD
jgi:hypothetical protein